LMDYTELIFISYCTTMLSSEDTNNMLDVTIPDRIRIDGSKLILQSFS
jgi:hypothetical protein